jgi:hypothetical protein
MVNKRRGNAVVSNKDSKHLFLCRTFDNRRYAPTAADFCTTDRLWRICNIIPVLLLALLILGRFSSSFIAGLLSLYIPFLFLEALDTFSSCSLEFSLFPFHVAVLHFIATFRINDHTSSYLFPLQMKSTRCGPIFFLQETPLVVIIRL